MRQIMKNYKISSLLPPILFLAFSAIFALFFSRNFVWAAGMSHDSVLYMNGAKSLLAGEGYPHTHFPPLYPAALALTAFITNQDVISSATLLAVLLYGMNGFLAGWLIWRLKGSLLGGLGVISVFALLPGIVRLHFEAMSEPLFFSMLFLTFICLMEYLKNGWLKWALLAGLSAGLAALTRYIAVYLIAAVPLTVFIFDKNPMKKRFTHTFMAGVAGLFPPAAWWLSNQISKGTVTNRSFVFHPKDLEFFQNGWGSFAELIGTQFITKWTLRLPGFIFTICAYVIVALIVYFTVKYFIKGKPAPLSRTFTLICLISLVLYVLALWFSVTFVDDSTMLTARIISPIFIQLFLCIWILFWPARQTQVSNPSRLLLSFLVLLIMFVNLPGYLEVTRTFRKDGFLFTGRAWSTSSTLSWLSQVPDSIPIYTNENIPLGFFTAHPAYSLPERKSVSSGVPNPSFKNSNEKMINEIRDGKALMIIFTRNKYSELYQSKEILVENLEKCLTFEDSEVYTGGAYFREYCAQ